MMKKYKWSLILGSLVTLLPIGVGLILWDRLPEAIPVHWGSTGKVDAMAGPWFVVFLLPVILLALHWFCVWISFKDPRTKKQNPKALGLVFWIIPVISLFCTGIIYSSAMGSSLNLFRLISLFLAAMFLIFGNYMPKITQNSYLGIKTKWTLYSEENWYATHRFCGRTWVICGFLVLAGSFLPEEFILPILLIPLVILILSCTLYSYFYYRKQVREGMAPIPEEPLTKKRLFNILGILLILLLLGAVLGYIMFTGDIQVHLNEASLTIEADFWSDLTVDYNAITSIEYLEEGVRGIRISGFSSGRLALGTFRNEEYGNFTLYAYTGCDATVLLRSGERILMVGGKTPEATLEIYESLKERIE